MTDTEQFALSNQMSLLIGKEANQFTREDLIKVIIDKKIERITFHYTGLDGRIKDLRIPIENRKHAEMVLSEGERVDGSSLFKGMVDPGKSDLYVIPLYKSAFFNPFDDGSIDFVCRFLNKDGELADYAPDNILKKSQQLLLKNTGTELWALGELEFYLIGKHQYNIFTMPPQNAYHASAPYIKTSFMLNEMLKHITQICGNVKYAHSEVGYIVNIESENEDLNGKSAEQVEIEFLLAPVDEMADNLIIATWIIRNIAYKYGYLVSFIPKIEVGHAGSGLHFHTALKKNGINITSDEKGNLSEEAKMLIGGMCHYAKSLTAFGNMASASYLRLVPHQEAPTKVCWSELNRSALIRIPLSWSNLTNLANRINPQQKIDYQRNESRQTVELRSPDGTANVHLLLAGITLAAEWGLTNKEKSLELSKISYLAGNLEDCESKHSFPDLPSSCVESAEILLEHKDLYEREDIFPSQVIKNISNILKKENDKGLIESLIALPDYERKIQFKKIMHGNLSRF